MTRAIAVILLASITGICAAGDAGETPPAPPRPARFSEIVFIKRHHISSPVGVGTMYAWDCYSPGGNICFSSTRSRSYSMCHPAPGGALFVMDAAGGDIRRIACGRRGDRLP